MRELPISTYSGLTIVLDRESRFDNKPTLAGVSGLISGYAGDFFNNALLADPSHGVFRDNCEIRTLDECQRSISFLDGTKTLLLLGEKCLAYFGKADVTLNEQRGSPFTYEDKICIASYTPQDAFDRRAFFADDSDNDGESDKDDSEGKSTHGKTQRKNWRFWSRQDVRKAVRLTRNGLNIVEPKIIIYPDAHEVVKLLSTTKGQTLYFDIETDSCYQLTCFGFSFGEAVYVVPGIQTHLTPRKYFYEALEWCKLLRALAVALRDNVVVIHNAMFDLFVLVWRYGLPIGGRVFDTMLAHNRNFIEVEKSLGHCISLYTDLPYHKNEGVFEPRTQSETEQLYYYNGKDVHALTQLKPAIEERAKLLGATESVEQVNRMVIPYLTAMLQGIAVDWNRVDKLVTTNDRMKRQISRMLEILTNKPDFNPNSPKQVSTYLYDEIGLAKPQKDFTNEKTLLQHKLKIEIPAIDCILRYRGLTKENSKVSFTPYRGKYDANYYSPDGSLSILSNSKDTTHDRFTCAYNLAGTTTMRLSSRRLLRLWGDNSQNFAKKLRKIIIPDAGKILGQNDQSGAEALIVAYLCRPGKFRDLFKYGIKPHVYVALHVFAEQWSRMPDKIDNNVLIRALITEPKDLRNLESWSKLEAVIRDSDNWEGSRRYYYMAKRLCHGGNYGMKGRTFKLSVLQDSEGTVALPETTCNQMLAKYHATFPEIQQWHADVISTVKRTSMLRNLFGHPRVFTGFHDESAYREWIAYVPQSTVGTITNYAFTELQEEIQAGKHPMDFDVLQNNHDSILWQSFSENRDYCSKLVGSKLNRRLVSPKGEEFYMKSEAQWSDKSWGEMLPL